MDHNPSHDEDQSQDYVHSPTYVDRDHDVDYDGP